MVVLYVIVWKFIQILLRINSWEENCWSEEYVHHKAYSKKNIGNTDIQQLGVMKVYCNYMMKYYVATTEEYLLKWEYVHKISLVRRTGHMKVYIVFKLCRKETI